MRSAPATSSSTPTSRRPTPATRPCSRRRHARRGGPPRATADVVAVMKIAAAHGVPVVPQGAGTGLAGAANAVDGAIMLVRPG